MANFRTTADYVDKILDLVGEITNGNSAFESDALYYLNRIHNSLLSGGTDILPEVDEIWPWAMAKAPMSLDLRPKYITGTVDVSGSNGGITFSQTTSENMQGWHIKFQDDDAVYKIVEHTGTLATASIDQPPVGGTQTGLTFEAFKLEYELVPGYFTFASHNNKIDFTETNAGTVLTATITSQTSPVTGGSGTAAQIKTAMDAAGDSVYTVTFNEDTRLYTITSDGAGGDGIFSLLGASGTNKYTSTLPSLGYGVHDYTGALTYTGERALGAIAKLSQPMFLHNKYEGTTEVSGIDLGRYMTDYPLSTVSEGKPTRFTVVEEREDGYIRIRFNRYVKDAQRMDVFYVPQPLDLYDNVYSAPLVPRKWSQVLTHGAAAYLAVEKNDDRAQGYLAMAQNQLTAMQTSYRNDENRVGANYAQVIARADLVGSKRRRLLYGYETD